MHTHTFLCLRISSPSGPNTVQLLYNFPPSSSGIEPGEHTLTWFIQVHHTPPPSRCHDQVTCVISESSLNLSTIYCHFLLFVCRVLCAELCINTPWCRVKLENFVFILPGLSAVKLLLFTCVVLVKVWMIYSTGVIFFIHYIFQRSVKQTTKLQTQIDNFLK